MSISLSISLPSGDIGFVENKRAFCVQGSIISDEVIPNEAKLKIELIDKENKVVRFIEADKKNKPIDKYNKGLTTYKEELDVGREKLVEFGFPELIVEDIDNPEQSLRKATIKCFYNDTCFKGIIINASDVDHGALLDDGIGFVDENDKPYSLLEMGEYEISVSLSIKDEVVAKAYKKVVIGQKKEQIICRFNPTCHKQRMIAWCKENGFSITEDLMPGYLDPYLGTWYYHMGLLTMYRANDICMYEKANIKMFVYLIDPTSTSYETELGYLQAHEALLDKERFSFYHYNIGEAYINDRKAKVLEFKDNEDIYLCRIDILNKKIKDNKYYLDNRDVKEVLFDFDNIELQSNSDIAIMGLVKPRQLNKEDFILRKDNTYEIRNAIAKIRYTFTIDNDELVIEKPLNMERIEEKSIGTSVFEFYNTFHIEEEWKNMTIKVLVEELDRRNNIIGNFKKFVIKVK